MEIQEMKSGKGVKYLYIPEIGILLSNDRDNPHLWPTGGSICYSETLTIKTSYKYAYWTDEPMAIVKPWLSVNLPF